jgi:hypothetical protein
MPTLPSGRAFALSMRHIIEPGTQMFTCPEGYYGLTGATIARAFCLACRYAARAVATALAY